MSAIFIASGPNIRVGRIERARNIDIAPTVLKLLGMRGSDTIEGKPLSVLRRGAVLPALASSLSD
jgi:arylsulfatase A-like enzyme